MLINYTNHPVSSWEVKQLRAAEAKWGSVIDLPFPTIDPMADKLALDKLAKTEINRIKKLKGAHILVMGEFSFFYLMTNHLKQLGFRCWVTTSSRSVIPVSDGEVRKLFSFEQFREL